MEGRKAFNGTSSVAALKIVGCRSKVTRDREKDAYDNRHIKGFEEHMRVYVLTPGGRPHAGGEHGTCLLTRRHIGSTRTRSTGKPTPAPGTAGQQYMQAKSLPIL